VCSYPIRVGTINSFDKQLLFYEEEEEEICIFNKAYKIVERENKKVKKRRTNEKSDARAHLNIFFFS
jgi:hypothetical protein